MTKYERPFQSGQPGKLYAALYPEPKTGYQGGIDAGLPDNKAYQFKDRYPDHFQDVDDGIKSCVGPIIAAIEEDLDSAGINISESELEELHEFLDSDWREVYEGAAIEMKEIHPAEADESDLLIDPYTIFQIVIGDAFSLLAGGGGPLDEISPEDSEQLLSEEEVEELAALGSALQCVFQLEPQTIAKLSQLPIAQDAILRYQTQSTGANIEQLAAELESDHFER